MSEVWWNLDIPRLRRVPTLMESGSPRILPALADWTHFYHAASGQFPATAQQCVNKKTLNSHLDQAHQSAKTG